MNNFEGWGSGDSFRAASVDYAGLADEWIEHASHGRTSFGTDVDGVVHERMCSDGTVEVDATIRTRNALVWVTLDPAGYNFNGPLIFGVRAPDVLKGARPALGDSLFQVTFINPRPWAKLPDLLQVFAQDPNLLTTTYTFNATAWQEGAQATVAQNSGPLSVVDVGPVVKRKGGK